MSPLPTAESSDPFAARWARLRARELRMLADGISADRPVLAERLRMHADCMDAPAAQPMVNAGPSLSGPLILVRPQPQLPERPKPPAPAPTPVPQVNFADVDQALSGAGDEIAAARFKRALELSEEARSLLEPKPQGDRREERLVRLEVLAATALVALGRSDEASQSFARALSLDPDLQLDERTTPPKILRLFERVREGSRNGGGVQ